MQMRRFYMSGSAVSRLMSSFLEWLCESQKEWHDFKLSGIFKEDNELGS